MTREPEIRNLPAQPAVVEHAAIDAAALPGTIDRTFPMLYGRLQDRGITPAGPPFIRYLDTGQRFELELGVPVPGDLAELDGAEVESLPAGRVAVLRYTGPYDGLREACEALGRWVEQQGEHASGPFWEVYVTDPRTEPDPAKRITEIYQPLI
jgi:effector-binding domain-containing protein